MHRFRSLCVALIVLLSVSAGAAVLAQDATPEVVEPVLTGDMAFREYADFGVVDAAILPAAPVLLNLFRIEFTPGLGVSYPPADLGLGIHLVESGA